MTTNCNKIKSTEAQCRYVLVIEKSDIWDRVLPNSRRQNWYPNPRVIYKSSSNNKRGPIYRWDRCRAVITIGYCETTCLEAFLWDEGPLLPR